MNIKSELKKHIKNMKFDIMEQILSQQTHKQRNDSCKKLLIRLEMIVDEIEHNYQFANKEQPEKDWTDNDDLPF